jgi:lipid-binding SYLF domain-containing protein
MVEKYMHDSICAADRINYKVEKWSFSRGHRSGPLKQFSITGALPDKSSEGPFLSLYQSWRQFKMDMDKEKKRRFTMKGKKRSLKIYFVSGLILCLGPAFFPSPALADYATDAGQLVEEARFTFQNFSSDPNMAAFRDLAKNARGILIAPQVLKGAFIWGASGGSGVLLTRQKVNGPWAGPAFYTIGEVSFGFQIGGEASQVILLAMTERGVTAFLGDSFKLGGNIGIAAGPIGAGASAASANLSVDILSFSISKGLYGGIAVDGAVVAVREGLNAAYYGKEVNPTDILIRRNVTNPRAAKLIETVQKVAGPQ